MEKAAIGDQNLLNALEPKKETLTVTSNEAAVSYAIGAALQVVSMAGTTTGPLGIVFSGTPTTGQVKVDRTNQKLVFAAADAVTQAYFEYLESVSE
jgi:hypothetical protein